MEGHGRPLRPERFHFRERTDRHRQGERDSGGEMFIAEESDSNDRSFRLAGRLERVEHGSSPSRGLYATRKGFLVQVVWGESGLAVDTDDRVCFLTLSCSRVRRLQGDKDTFVSPWSCRPAGRAIADFSVGVVLQRWAFVALGLPFTRASRWATCLGQMHKGRFCGQYVQLVCRSYRQHRDPPNLRS